MRHPIRAQIERCLQELWEVSHVSADDDGDYPFRAGTAACWVRLDSHNPLLIRVIGHAVEEVERSNDLFGELNDVNARARTTSVAWDDGVIRVMAVLHPDGLTSGSLRHAMSVVGL